jgi:hypothetical protein
MSLVTAQIAGGIGRARSQGCRSCFVTNSTLASYTIRLAHARIDQLNG